MAAACFSIVTIHFRHALLKLPWMWLITERSRARHYLLLSVIFLCIIALMFLIYGHSTTSLLVVAGLISAQLACQRLGLTFWIPRISTLRHFPVHLLAFAPVSLLLGEWIIFTFFLSHNLPHLLTSIETFSSPSLISIPCCSGPLFAFCQSPTKLLKYNPSSSANTVWEILTVFSP